LQGRANMPEEFSHPPLQLLPFLNATLHYRCEINHFQWRYILKQHSCRFNLKSTPDYIVTYFIVQIQHVKLKFFTGGKICSYYDERFSLLLHSRRGCISATVAHTATRFIGDMPLHRKTKKQTTLPTTLSGYNCSEPLSKIVSCRGTACRAPM